MPEELIRVLANIGGFCVIFVIICIGVILKEKIMDLPSKIKFYHERKHRFDKPPTAKCYCIDCEFYSSEDQTCCMYAGYRMAPYHFCAKGDPKGYE